MPESSRRAVMLLIEVMVIAVLAAMAATGSFSG